MRLDLYLVAAGYAVSRAKAQAMIKSGCVCIGGEGASKPSLEVGEGAEITVLPNDVQKYVSRGGLKLEAALSAFSFSPEGHVALDVGASSGGFTDCLLKGGASLFLTTFAFTLLPIAPSPSFKVSILRTSKRILA